MAAAISPQAVLPPVPPAIVSPGVIRVPHTSSTDRKIFCLVVLGNIIKGLAYVAATAAIVAAVVVNPLSLLCLIPILTIGVLGNRLAEARGVSNGSIYIPGITPGFFTVGQPSGLQNIYNNCWANSLMQMVMHVPSLEALIQTLPQGYDPLRLFVQNYRASQAAQQMIAVQASSQRVRECLHLQNRSQRGESPISPSSWRQEDAGEALSLILNHVNSAGSPLFHQVRMTREDGALVNDTRECIVPVDLFNHGNRPFEELIRGYFHTVNGNNQIERRRFGEAPQELLVQMNRFSHNARGESYKINDPIRMPQRFTVLGEYVQSGEASEMICDSFIEHIGSSPRDGHYVIFIKNPRGGGWRCSDMNIMPVSDPEWDEAIQRSYLLHFRRA